MCVLMRGHRPSWPTISTSFEVEISSAPQDIHRIPSFSTLERTAMGFIEYADNIVTTMWWQTDKKVWITSSKNNKQKKPASSQAPTKNSVKGNGEILGPGTGYYVSGNRQFKRLLPEVSICDPVRFRSHQT